MNRMIAALWCMALASLCVQADTGAAPDKAVAILERVVANRAEKDFSLKARLFLTREKFDRLEILVKNSGNETRTIYRSGELQVLVVDPVQGQPRFYVKGSGQLTPQRSTERLLGSHFTYYDLGLPFLHWPNAKFVGDERVKGRDCLVIDTTATGEPYARVKMWIDREYYALLRAEAYNEDGDLTKRFAVASFKKIGAVWVPRALDIADVPPGQSLPYEERSRLEVYEGDYDVQLSPALFDTDAFAATTK